MTLPLLAAQQARAQELLEPDVLSWVLDAAVEGEWDRVRLRPRVLRDVSTVSTRTTLLGTELAAPVLVGPTAFHGKVHVEGERATNAGAEAAGSLMVWSMRASVPFEGSGWWQAYVLQDAGRTLDACLRARDGGATAIVLTGDTPYLGTARRGPLGDLEQAPATLADVDLLASRTGLPVLVKGVLRGDDAEACLQAGAAGVVVSNHGGRQLPRAVPTAQALPEVVQAVAGRAPVLVDGGIRSGIDVLCALALGADAVLLGKPVLWALAADGARGVEACLRAVADDLRHVLGLAGCAGLDEVGPDLVSRPA